MAFLFQSVKQFYPGYHCGVQVETLITAITSTMDESKKVARELVAIQERQVGEDNDINSGCLKIPHVSLSRSWSHSPENTSWQIASSAERRS